jgi:hypothetical protein
MTKLPLVVLAVMAFAGPRARTQGHLNLVIALNLSRSGAATGLDGGNDFQKSVEGVSHAFAQVDVGTYLTIIGITDRSFTEPNILMRVT